MNCRAAASNAGVCKKHNKSRTSCPSQNIAQTVTILQSHISLLHRVSHTHADHTEFGRSIFGGKLTWPSPGFGKAGPLVSASSTE